MAKKRKRRNFDAHFKAEAVRLCKVGERSVGQVARDLDLTETSLREWVRQAGVVAVNGSPDTLATAEREELGRLRKQVKRLEMKREILKKPRPSSRRGASEVRFHRCGEGAVVSCLSASFSTPTVAALTPATTTGERSLLEA